MAAAALHVVCAAAVCSHPLNLQERSGRLCHLHASARLHLHCIKSRLHAASARRQLRRTAFMPETSVLLLPRWHFPAKCHSRCWEGETVAELAGEGQLDSSGGGGTSTSSGGASGSAGGRATAATVAAAMSTENLLEAAEAALGMDFDSLGVSDRSPRTGGRAAESTCGLQDGAFLRKVALCKDADEALEMICQQAGEGSAGVVTTEEAGTIMKASLAAGNTELAFSLLNAMRASLSQKRLSTGEKDEVAASVRRWQWAPPDVSTYATLIRGLAASLRVADAVQTVTDVRRRGVPAGDEVPFGKVVDCPCCKKPIAVVQPQNGVQLVPCARCRYQYELMSGDVVSSESEPVSGDMSVFERGLRTLRLARQPAPAAVHSMVVRAPDGVARTHRFATTDAEVPAQVGERVTVVSSAPASSQWIGLGPLRSNARAPGWRPSEPMSVTNHETSRVSALVRAPPKAGTGAAWDANILLPAALLLAGSDAATAFIDPALPQLIAAGAVAAAASGGIAKAYVLPRLNQLPERSVGGTAIRQQLLAQHELLQSRLESLTSNASDEVRMLARMCQLQNKMEAIGEPATYSARIERVRQARDGLDQRLDARLELIDSYAKILSMIEIEVELDADILAAEQAGAAENIADQIEKLMEVEALQKEWKLQAEANDEVERLLRSAPPLPENA